MTVSVLANAIKSTISFCGPISIAHYMRLALTHPTHGYYATGNVFGKDGDFVTSPELSQIPGELTALWFLSTLKNSKLDNNSPGYHFLELGPGKGKMLTDIVRTLSRFPGALSPLQSLTLVEASPALRKAQLRELSKLTDVNCVIAKDLEPEIDQKSADGRWNATLTIPSIEGSKNLKITWLDSLVDFDNEDAPVFMIANEFFDAFGVHKFIKTENGWREIVVDLKEDIPESAAEFELKVSKSETKATTLLRSKIFLPNDLEVGSLIEIAPDTAETTEMISKILSKNEGVALIVDYGKDEASQASLRAIRNHKFVDPLQTPGAADISADVDFSLIKRVVKNGKNNIQAFGPVTQQNFLETMGIRERLKMISETECQEKFKSVESEVARLTNPDEMGNIYKYMAIASSTFSKNGLLVFQNEDIKLKHNPLN